MIASSVLPEPLNEKRIESVLGASSNSSGSHRLNEKRIESFMKNSANSLCVHVSLNEKRIENEPASTISRPKGHIYSFARDVSK